MYPFIGRSIGRPFQWKTFICGSKYWYKIQTPNFHNVDQSKQTIIHFPAKSQSRSSREKNDRKIVVCSSVYAEMVLFGCIQVFVCQASRLLYSKHHAKQLFMCISTICWN